MAFPFLQAAALLYGAYRYFTKPKLKDAAYKGGNIEVTATSNASVPICYGNCEVTGNIIYKEDTTSATNQLAVGLCEGPIQSIDSVTVNGISIPAYPAEYEGCSYTPYYGTAAQTTDARFTTSLMRVTCSENNYVDEANPAVVQNYYSTDRLIVYDNKLTGLEKYTFLKFNISSLNLTASSDISSATLRLTVVYNTPAMDHTFYVYKVTDDSWTETTVTWNNKPAFGDLITTIDGGSIVAANSVYCDIDITQWVKDTFDDDASKIVGIGLKLVAGSNDQQVTISSRDSGGAPELLIRYSPKELVAFAHTAYVALTIKDSDLFRGHINDIKVRLHGRKIYDGDVNPNYSTNPAWCVYDQLTSARYGADIPTALINAASFTAVASYCDTAITNEDGVSETRHRCDVVFDDKDTVADRINAVLASFGGYLYTLDGKINLGVDCSASSSHTFTMDNIIAGSFNFWMIDKSEAPNDVSVMYYDAANDFKASYVNVKDQTLIDSYGRNFEEIQLTCINRYSQASRMAKYYLNKTIYSTYGCSFKVSINHCNVAPGDVCEITHTVPGWTAKDFRIISVVEDSNDELEITCEEYDSDLYSDEGLPYTPPEGSTLPNPNELPPIVTGLTLTESHAQGDDGTYIPQIKVDWTVPDYQFPLQYIVWYKLHAAADYIYWELSTDNLAYINTDGAGQYDVVVQTVNQLSGIKTDFGTSPSETITLAGKTDPPSDVEFNDINCTFYQEVYLEWLPVTDTDLAFYEVRTDTNWGNSTNLVYQGKGTAYIMANPALTTYTFYIKARDLSDNYSDNADSLALTKADPVLGAITIDFSGRDCFLTWEHTEDKDFVKYQIKVYSDAARTALVRTENIASPPYIYTYENNASDNSGTAIRHPYFTVYKLTTLAQSASQNCDDDNAAPGAPTGLTLTPGQGKLFISWTAPAGSDIIGYNVYAKTSSPADTLIAFVNATNYTFDPESENTYYVTVAAVDPFGEGTKCSEETQTTNPYALTNYSLDVPMTSGINYTVAGGKVTWTTGKLWYEGTEYTIAAETTGTAHAFIYWDKDSPTVFLHSDTPPALDDDVWVMAYFDGTSVSGAYAQKIIHGGLIQASSIEAEKLSVDQLSAIAADLGTVTSGTMQTATTGKRIVIDGSDNSLSFYDGVAVDAIFELNTGVDGTNSGILLRDGVIYNFSEGGTFPNSLSIDTCSMVAYNSDRTGKLGIVSALTEVAVAYGVIVAQAAADISVDLFAGVDHTLAKVFTVDNDGNIDANKITTVDDITTGDKLIFNRANDVTVDATSPASGALTYTIPDAGAAASFVMTESAQTVNGVKTFGSFPVTPSAAPTSDYQVANKKYVDDNTIGSHALLSTAHSDTMGTGVTCGALLVGNSSLKWTRLTLGASGHYLKSDGTNVVWAPVTASPGGSDAQVQYNKSGSMAGSSLLTFNDSTGALSLTKLISTDDISTGDKLIFTRTSNVVVGVTTPSATRNYTIPDAGGDAEFVMTAGAQTVNGVKTFGSFPVTPSSAPTTDYQVANKKYVDDNAGGSTSPGGSDSYVQYNNGGAFGGDATFVYNDTTHRLTAQSASTGSNAVFTTSTTDGADIDGLLVTNAQDPGNGNFGSSIGFSKHGSVTRHAAIVAKQTTTDSDQVGLSIFTHPSSTGSDPMVEAIEISHTGHITLKNSATVFKLIDCPTLSMKVPAANYATLERIKTNGSGSAGVYAMGFKTGGTYSLLGSIRLPLDYKDGTSLYPHINRMIDVAPDATSDVVRIGLEYTWCLEDGTMSNTSTPEKEIAVGADSSTKLIRSELDAISGSGKTAGSTLIYRLYREAAVTGVECERNLYITSLAFEYESDKLGSNATTV